MSFQMPLADARAQWGRTMSIPAGQAAGQQPGWKGQCGECLRGDTRTACPGGYSPAPPGPCSAPAPAVESRDKMIPAPPQLVLTNSLRPPQPVARRVMAMSEAAGAERVSHRAWSRDVLSGGLMPELDRSTSRLTLLPHYAIFTRYWEYEIIIPSDRILIMQHRG